MSKQNDEVERLMRLRQKQLQARDPQAKQRAVQRKVAKRRQKLNKPSGSFTEMLTDVPHKWKGIIIGAVLGVVISVLLPMFVEASWVEYAGLAAVIVLSIIGFFFGQALDVRDELKDLVND